MKVEYPGENDRSQTLLSVSELTRSTERQASPGDHALAELEARKAKLLAVAQSITVQDQSSFEFAATLRQQVRKASDAIESLLRPNIVRLHDAHKSALADLKRLRDPLDRAEAAIKAKQDSYQSAILRSQREEKERIERAMEEARQRTLREEIAAAAASASTTQMDSVIERMAQPPIEMPMIPVKAKAAGASGTLVKKFRLLDPTKISPAFLLAAVKAEIAEKGECEWLTRAINKEIRYRGKGAEAMVGDGSIEYYEEISTGVRR
jgi:hypothetical protein